MWLHEFGNWQSENTTVFVIKVPIHKETIKFVFKIDINF